MNGPNGGPGQFFFGRGPGGFGGYDTGVSVLAIALRALIWVLVIMALVWLAREVLRLIQRGPRHHVPPPPSPAIAELDMMYARGEISRADYLVRRTDLAGAPPPAPPAG
jgi:uncharacterized membrane protein